MYSITWMIPSSIDKFNKVLKKKKIFENLPFSFLGNLALLEKDIFENVLMI